MGYNANMRFQVPQFIEVEDKIFGQLSFKQFVYLVGAGGLAFIIYKFTPLLVWIILSPAAVVFGLALAFYKVNNKPFIDVIQAALSYYINTQLYIWRKTDKKAQATTTTLGNAANIEVPKLNQSKLKDLAWSLDVHESAYSNETKTLQENARIRMEEERKKNPFHLEF